MRRSDSEETGKLGLAVRPLTGDEREELHTAGRLVVEGADGPAAIAGVERGDVILAVNGAAVDSIGAFRTAVNASGATVALLIQRDNAPDFRARSDRILMMQAAVATLGLLLVAAAAPSLGRGIPAHTRFHLSRLRLTARRWS